MELYSAPQCPQCQRVRIVMHEKDTHGRIYYTSDQKRLEDLGTINPDFTTPTFHDRGLALVEPRIIMEYLDDRYPHPALMPIDPLNRARARVWLLSIERNLYGQLADLRSPGAKKSKAARDTICSFLLRVGTELRQQEKKRFFTSDNFTLLDASLGPILWRLKPCYGIDLPRGLSANVLWKYADTLYDRASFTKSLTQSEKDLHLR